MAAAEALRLKGIDVRERRLVQYLYVDAGHRNMFRRVKPAEFTDGGLDTEKYADLAREAAENLINALGGDGSERVEMAAQCKLFD